MSIFTTVFLGGCVTREKDNTLKSMEIAAGPVYEPDQSNFEEKLAINRTLPRELVLKLS